MPYQQGSLLPSVGIPGSAAAPAPGCLRTLLISYALQGHELRQLFDHLVWSLFTRGENSTLDKLQEYSCISPLPERHREKWKLGFARKVCKLPCLPKRMLDDS